VNETDLYVPKCGLHISGFESWDFVSRKFHFNRKQFLFSEKYFQRLSMGKNLYADTLKWVSRQQTRRHIKKNFADQVNFMVVRESISKDLGKIFALNEVVKNVFDFTSIRVYCLITPPVG
jgi:hypothetical protein